MNRLQHSITAMSPFGPSRNPYFRLTDTFNAGRTRAVLTSGQACVYYRLAMVSKDGDWIVHEHEQDLAHIRSVLEAHGARYRIGAPLALPWLSGGWSSHLEFADPQGHRLRTDFVSRPPRLSTDRLQALWRNADQLPHPVLPPDDLILLKQTMRLKDYPFIGALATRLADTSQRLRHERDATSLIQLAQQFPEACARIAEERPLLNVKRQLRLPLDVN